MQVAPNYLYWFCLVGKPVRVPEICLRRRQDQLRTSPDGPEEFAARAAGENLAGFLQI